MEKEKSQTELSQLCPYLESAYGSDINGIVFADIKVYRCKNEYRICIASKEKGEQKDHTLDENIVRNCQGTVVARANAKLFKLQTNT